MITYTKKAGTVDVSVILRIIDSADRTPETGVVFNTSGIDLWYRREGAASVDITEVTLAALTTAHTDGGFLHVNDGHYRLDLPDAACASGVTGVLIGGTVTGMIVLGCYIQLVAFDPYNAGNSDSLPTISDLGTEGDIAAAVMASLVESGISASSALTNDTGTQLTSINVKQALATILSAVAAVLAGANSTPVTTKPAGKPAGNTRISAVVDATGRTAVTLKVPD